MGAYTKWDYLHNKLPHPQRVYSCVTQFPCLNRKWDEIQTPDSWHRPARFVQCQSQTYRKYVYPFLVDPIRYSQEKACKSAFMYGQKLQKWRKMGHVATYHSSASLSKHLFKVQLWSIVTLIKRWGLLSETHQSYSGRATIPNDPNSLLDDIYSKLSAPDHWVPPVVYRCIL